MSSMNNSQTVISNVFDVTLRDGLQALTSEEQKYFTIDKKKDLYKEIIRKYDVTNLEIGSCVNYKVLPMFSDIEELFVYAEREKLKYNRNINNYVLVPNKNYLINALNIGVTNFSFITSVSNSFQLKNTKMSVEQNLINLQNMVSFLDDLSKLKITQNKTYNIKLYVSCINECPIEGKLLTTKIVDELITLSNMKFSKLCLSDTCGSLTKSEFIDIIEAVKKHGIDVTKFSLHLHINPNREKIAEELIHSALGYGITEYDVSELDKGGCSVTMDKNKLLPNMSYKQYNNFIINYL